MNAAAREEYLQALEDLLPRGEAARVRADVEGMILDRIEAECEAHPDIDSAEAERRALEALGPPERLADDLIAQPLVIPVATRRAFVRLLAAVFACHLLLAIVLTVAGARSAPIPGLLGPLPSEPFGAVLLGVITIFLIDAGALLVIFVAGGGTRPSAPLVRLPQSTRWTRRGAVEGLILLALLAVIVNAFVDTIFAVKLGDEIRPFLTPDLRAIVPFANVVLALFGVRHVLTLVGRAGSIPSVAADALGSLSGSVLLVTAATRGKLVQMPAGAKLSPDAAQVLDSLVERVFLLVFIVGALLLVIRFVRQALRLHRQVRG